MVFPNWHSATTTTSTSILPQNPTSVVPSSKTKHFCITTPAPTTTKAKTSRARGIELIGLLCDSTSTAFDAENHCGVPKLFRRIVIRSYPKTSYVPSIVNRRIAQTFVAHPLDNGMEI